jgi:phage terminase large subunit
MEEANGFTEDDFNEVLGRMRGRAAGWRQIILSTNPDAPTHWIKRRLIDRGEAKTYYSRAADNPSNPEEYVSILGRLTGVLGARLREGQWIQAEGAVYEIFNDSIHIVDPFPVPQEWRRFRCIDFGFTNPFICQWWTVDPDGRMYMYREMYMTRRTVKVHAGQILYFSQGEAIEQTVTDHDAEDRATLDENGIYSTGAVKDVSRGLQAVEERLKLADDKRPRIFFFRNALVEMDIALEEAKRPVCTVQEFPAYVWPKTADGRPVKEVPVKENDHGMDATRYAVMYVDGYRPTEVIDNPFW